MSRPPISVWEQTGRGGRLREQGRAEVDEDALFAMVAQMREITTPPRRHPQGPPRPNAAAPHRPGAARPQWGRPPPRANVGAGTVVPPFEVIEQW